MGVNHIIWEILSINEKLYESVCHTQTYVYSPSFLTSINHQPVYVRLYLHGNRDRKYLAAYLYMNIPQQSSFKGTVRFTLVDQSRIGPSHNIVKECDGCLAEIGDCIGCEQFTDKNDLHKDPNRFIRDDKITLFVQLRPHGKNSFGNVSPGLLHAMTSN